MEKKRSASHFVVCLKNDGYSVSLEKRKIYKVIPDAVAKTHQMIRVVDESGDDYLYPSGYFAPISLPRTLAKELALAV
jgi:hypothetical protein